jgi:DNA-directed RNA polymerase subunit RPC12/RpoP
MFQIYRSKTIINIMTENTENDKNTYNCLNCGIPFVVPSGWEHDYAGCTNCGMDSKVSELSFAKKNKEGKWLGIIPKDSIPMYPDGTPMRRFEVKGRKREDGTVEKGVFIDGEKLDWTVDITSLMDAKSMGPSFFKEIQKDIEKHYTESVGEVLGRKVTALEIKQAIKVGWI